MYEKAGASCCSALYYTVVTVSDLEHLRKTSEISRELGRVSRALAQHCLTVELALERRDWVALHEAADVACSLSARFIELRRGLLVIGVRGFASIKDVTH
jgi:hypothetical protein